MQEFYVPVTSKIEVPMSAAAALEWIEEFEAFPCLAVDVDLIKIAAEQSVRYRISYWDGAIVAAAGTLGAKTLFSEDLNHGPFNGSERACQCAACCRRVPPLHHLTPSDRRASLRCRSNVSHMSAPRSCRMRFG